MSIRAHVAALKEHLENLFPGKWVTASQERSKTLLTGTAEIDKILPRGLARQRITEWHGPVSSGKTTLLRAAIANWCAAGFNVAYVDTGDKLAAADWAFVEHGERGRFWVIRPNASSNPYWAPPCCALGRGEPPENQDQRRQNRADTVQQGNDGEEPPQPAGADGNLPLQARKSSGMPLHGSTYIWIATQLICSNAFDVVVLDLGSTFAEQLSSQTYARLQSSLSRSKTALIVVNNNSNASNGWGCHTRLTFGWGDTVDYQAGISGIALIIPTVRCAVRQNGLSQSTEVTLISHVPNRLLTHPQVPDRRAPKT